MYRFGVLHLLIEKLHRHKAKIVVFSDRHVSRCIIGKRKHFPHLVVEKWNFARVSNE
jgi:hypothetical protein